MLRIVETKFGKIEGLPAADPRITSFKGIPFAEQPVGNLRWHAPVAWTKKWEGTMHNAGLQVLTNSSSANPLL